MAVAGPTGAAEWEEVKLNTMRKFFALSMVALLALTLAIAAVSCGQKQEETPAASTETSTTPAPADTSASMMADTTMHADSAATK